MPDGNGGVFSELGRMVRRQGRHRGVSLGSWRGAKSGGAASGCRQRGDEFFFLTVEVACPELSELFGIRSLFKAH